MPLCTAGPPHQGSAPPGRSTRANLAERRRAARAAWRCSRIENAHHQCRSGCRRAAARVTLPLHPARPRARPSPAMAVRTRSGSRPRDSTPVPPRGKWGAPAVGNSSPAHRSRFSSTPLRAPRAPRGSKREPQIDARRRKRVGRPAARSSNGRGSTSLAGRAGKPTRGQDENAARPRRPSNSSASAPRSGPRGLTAPRLRSRPVPVSASRRRGSAVHHHRHQRRETSPSAPSRSRRASPWPMSPRAARPPPSGRK